MEETQQVPNQNPVIPPVAPIATYPTSQPAPTSKTRLLVVTIVLLIAIASYFGYQYYRLKQQLVVQQPTPSSSENVVSSPLPTTPVGSATPTENWKTYQNTPRHYQIKYPSNWKIDTSKAETSPEDIQGAELTISQGKYSLKIMWPSAFGPGICLFDDQSRDGAPEMASYCEGKFVEFKNKSGSTHRHLVSSKSDVPSAGIAYDHAEWEIYTQELNSKYFVTVPPIRYSAPLQYEQSQINLMDQILATFTSTQ